ncbi:MAG TPA: DUF192 domain-containing protein [Euzebyales bacterium]|nr:DUF192 domain-containing protein [Euzebyales bacterium]
MRALLPAVLLLVLAACGQGGPVSQDTGGDTAVPTSSAALTVDPATLRPSEGFDVSEVVFTDGDERITMPVLVADEPSLRSTGLMRRTELADDAGMLFVFDEPTSGAFWMKDTLLPLSIAFVGSDGTVQQVLDMEPCAANPCPRYTPDDPYVRAVEANQGYFAAHDITVGWSLEFGGRGGGGQ